MEIRLAIDIDAPEVLEIYDKARDFMCSSGNPHQWNTDYPSVDTFKNDIDRGGSYVCIENGRIVATFFFIIGEEPTYKLIEDGEWLDSKPYGVIHRVASDGTTKGVMHRVLDFCFSLTPNIRIDTHRDNLVMQNSLMRYGFKYCGIIHLANGDERLAYQLHRTGGMPNITTKLV